MSLSIRVLGGLEVRRDGVPVPLPRSRKTRALLAYLALEPREHRRDQLVRMLWDVPDDPRAALRWSLSKLRKVVDEQALPRLLATRAHVTLAHVRTDLLDLEQAVRGDLEARSTEELRVLMGEGEVLEGESLPELELGAWLIAQRRRAARLQAAVAQVLSRRALPETEALWLARTWARIDPEDAAARDYMAAQSSPSRRDAGHSERVEVPGRGEELRFLDSQFDRVHREQRARLVLLLGEPGLGKTTVLEAFVRGQLRGVQVLQGCGYEAARGRPLGLFAGLVDLGAGDSDPVPEVARRLREVVQDGTVLVVVDDAHLADPSSALVLRDALRTRGPLLMVLAARAAELADNAELQAVLDELTQLGCVERFRLGGLPRDVLGTLLDASLSEPARTRILDGSEGNPLYALEMSRAETAGIDGAGDLARTVRLRIARLGPQLRSLLGWAAILERGTWASLQRLSVAGETLPADLDQSERYGLLMLDLAARTFCWRHALLREAVLDSLSPMTQMQMHARAVEVLLQTDGTEPERLAYHAERAGNPERAATVSLEAARRCAADGGLPETVRYCQAALRYSVELPRKARLEVEIDARVLWLQVDRQDPALSAARLNALGMEALEANAHRAARDAFYWVGSLRWESGETEAEVAASARHAYLAGSLTTDAVDAATPAQSAYCLAVLERDFPRVEALLQEADSLCRTHGAIPPELPLARGALAEHRGEWARARESYADARVVARAASDPLSELHALERLARLSHTRGERHACSEAVLGLRALRHKAREGGETPLAEALLALLEGDPVGVARGLAELDRLDDKRRQAFLNARCALGLSGDEAERYARRAMQLGEEIEAPSDRAIGAAVCLAAAARRSEDDAYVQLEDTIASLEHGHVLSHVARRIISEVTEQRTARESPQDEGANPHADRFG